MSERVTVDAALQLLLPAYLPADAAARLDIAVKGNDCRLWCNGNLLPKDYVATALRVVVKVEADGRFRAEVVSATRETWVDGPFKWELDKAEVLSLPLKPDAPPQRRRGPPTKKVWLDICGEIARRCIDETGRLRVPKSERKLARDVLQWLEDQDLGQPAESEMREAVKRVCAALRPVQK